MKNYLEIWFWKIAIKIIKSGYGTDCETSDLDDFNGIIDISDARCASCRAKEVIDWINGHIELLEFYD